MEIGDNSSASVVEWLDAQQRRAAIRRRARWCAAGAWMMMSVAAIVGSYVAIGMALDMKELFGTTSEFWGRNNFQSPIGVYVVPVALVTIAIALVLTGLICWITGRIPGFSKAFAALDWSSASDAMTRLLAGGCTYPEAYRTAASAVSSNVSRNWLNASAARIESGGPGVKATPGARGDIAMLELMIDATESEPQQQWGIAADHFFELATRRLTLLTQAAPTIATIVSGILIWISISATLGWMWRAVAQMIGGLT
ncbi:MAG: hypothetical protein AB8B91_21860 [Rubripirellula sp.]